MPKLLTPISASTDNKGQVHRNAATSLRNLDESHLYQLPTELILEIYSYLTLSGTAPNVAKMALRATCLRFYAVLPTTTISQNQALHHGCDRRAYSVLQRQGRFRTLCAKEREGLLDGKLACCICSACHSDEHFTEREIGAKPEKRMYRCPRCPTSVLTCAVYMVRIGVEVYGTWVVEDRVQMYEGTS